jgi:hypothetical protein
MALAPPTNPSEAFGAGDPRNAKYFENLAALEHAYNTTLAGDQETLANDKTNAEYQQGLLTKAEPGTYKANQAKANAGGILESGVNAGRRGTIASQYGQKRYTITHGLQENEGRLRKADETAKYTYESGRGKAANEALSEGYKALLEQQPNESAPKAPTPPAQQQAINQGVKPGAGGVVPYEGGGVRVGMAQPPRVIGQRAQPNSVGVRKAAAKKAVG